MVDGFSREHVRQTHTHTVQTWLCRLLSDDVGTCGCEPESWTAALTSVASSSITCVCVFTSEFNGLLAISIHEQFQSREAIDVKLLSQLLLLYGVHFGQTHL